MRAILPIVSIASMFAVAGLLQTACSSSSSSGVTPDTTGDGGAAGDDAGSGDAGTVVSLDASVCSPVPADPTEAQRTSCTFKAGAKVADSLGVDAAARAKLLIGHVVIVLKENRSFDEVYGSLKATRPEVNGVDATFTNPGMSGATVASFHSDTTCAKTDPGHQWDNMHAMWDMGKMDGFVSNAIANTSVSGATAASDGKYVMGTFDRTQLPFYYFLADTFALADNFHCDGLSGTTSNRAFLLSGSSHGVKNTGFDLFPADAPVLMSALDAAGITWGAYTDDSFPFDGTLLPAWDGSHKGVYKVKDFIAQAAAGTLPQVTFVDAGFNTLDEHPPADVQKGEAWTKSIYDAVVGSPLWLKDGKGIAMIYTYDESGGFADHVAPPKACVPGTDAPDFDTYGFRVPMVMISPYARHGYVSHKLHSHASILRLVETLYDLPAMSDRDANSDALLDMFDFVCAHPGLPTAPAAGTGGCK
jgi:phospholipase C